MTADQYVETILYKYQVPRGPSSPAERFGNVVAGPLRSWANQYLNTLEYSGSYAKETGVLGNSDVDILISLASNTPGTLRDNYNELYRFANNQGWSPRLQNVSIGVSVNGIQGDLVPGKVQPGYQNYHSLFLRKKDSWTQTNIKLHIDTVAKSGRLREIRTLKIWRNLRNLDFASLYLELFTIQTLAGRPWTPLAENVLLVLRTIGTSLSSTRIEDPSNTNNVLSDDLNAQEKNLISRLAWQASQERFWEKIIW